MGTEVLDDADVLNARRIRADTFDLDGDHIVADEFLDAFHGRVEPFHMADHQATPMLRPS